MTTKQQAKAIAIIDNLLIGCEQPSLIKAYFDIIKKAIEINLERINNYPKINVIDYVIKTFDVKNTANEQFTIWYDVNNPLRNILELDSDKIFEGNTDIR